METSPFKILKSQMFFCVVGYTILGQLEIRFTTKDQRAVSVVHLLSYLAL